MVSNRAKQEALAQESTAAWFFLLEIQHATIGTKYYVNNTEPVTSNGQQYEPYVFELQLSINEESGFPEVALVIDNVDQALVAAIRAHEASPTFNVHLVLSDTPDVYEAEIYGLTLLEASYDAYTIQGTLYLDDFLSMRYPVDAVSTTSGFNGLFGR